MLADSELGDKQLPDQCSGAPGQIQWSVTKCDVVGPSDGASPLAEGSRWPEGHGCGPWKHQREQCGQRTSDERNSPPINDQCDTNFILFNMAL